MIAVDLLTGLAGLLDDEVSGVRLDDALDRSDLVSWEHDEVVALVGDPVVGGGGERDRLEAARAAAFTVERGRTGDAVQMRALVDLLVDPAEDLLVTRCPRGEVHSHGSSPSGPGAKRAGRCPARLVRRVRVLARLSVQRALRRLAAK